MADRQLPELRTRIRLDTSDLTRAQGTAERFIRTMGQKIDTAGLDRFSAKADQIGDKMSRNVTLPVLAAGAASAKMALDFNTAFTQMTTLAGVTGDEIEGLKKHVQDLAVETGRSPDELAKALYFIRSAGLTGADALGVLDASAKGAAIGLGDAASVADAVTSAINTYGKENLSGARAVDILSAAVAEGKGEASEFAPQLGRLLPIASTLGITFDEVAGSLAFLTKGSGDTALAATNLSGIMAALLKPTEQGRKQLDEMGISADSLRESVDSNGLLPTLELLNDKLGGNKDALGRLFEDRQALDGFIALTQNAGAAQAVIDETTNSTDYLAEAVEKLQDDPGFNLNKSLAELKVQAIQVGEQVLPVLVELAETGGDVLGFFTALPQPVQTAVLALVAVAAAIGPIAKTAGVATNGISLLMKAAKSEALVSFRAGLAGTAQAGSGAAASLGGMLSTVGATPLAMGAAVVGIGGLLYALSQMEDKADRARKAAKALAAEADRTGKSVEQVFREQLAATMAGQEEGAFDGLGKNYDADYFGRVFEAIDIDPGKIGDALLGTVDQYDALIAKVKELRKENDPEGNNTGGVDDALFANALTALADYRIRAETAKNEGARLDEVQKSLGVDTEKTAGATDRQADSLDDLGGAAGASAEELATLAGEARDLFDAQQAAADAADGVVEAQAAVADARAQGAAVVADALDAVTDAEEALTDAQASSREAALSLADARREAAEQLEDLELAASSAIVSESEAQTALLRAQQEAQDLDTADPIAKREAADKVARAQQALAEAREGNGDAAQAYADAQAKGIEGSDAVVAAQQRVADAAESERDAQERVGEATARVAEVRRESAEKVDEATRRVIDAQLAAVDAAAALAEKTGGAAASNAVLVEQLNALAATLDPANPLRQRLAAYAAELAALPTFAGPAVTVDDQGRLSQSIASLDGYRAQGGPVYPGRAYAVNENPNSIRPEVFVPDVAGRIRNADQVAGAPSVSIEQSFTVNGSPDAATLALLARTAKKAAAEGVREAVSGVSR